MFLVSVSDQNSFSLYSLGLLCSVSEILLKYTANKGLVIEYPGKTQMHVVIDQSNGQSNAPPRHSNCAYTCVSEESLSIDPLCWKSP